MRLRTALPSAGVPDTESLRRAALQASWLRDRRVGRRRLLGRWVTWFVLRGVLPALALAGVLALAWLLMQDWLAGQAPATASIPALATPSPPASAAASGAGLPAQSAPVLRLDLHPSPEALREEPGKPGQPSPSTSPPKTSGDTRP